MKLIAALILGLGVAMAHTSGAFAQILGDKLCDTADRSKTAIVVLIGRDGMDRHHFCHKAVRPNPTEVATTNTTSIRLELRQTQWVLIGMNTCIWYKNSKGELEEVCWED